MNSISSVIQSPVTHDLESTKSFYLKLGFEQVSIGNEIYFTDGLVVVGVNPDRVARTTIRLFGNDWDSSLPAIKSLVEVHEHSGKIICSDPSGVRVQLEPENSFEISGNPQSALGKFGGLSIETTEFDRCLEFWTVLGYQQSVGDPSHGWVGLDRNNCFGVSIMKFGVCPHLFFSPGLNYFNSGKNVENIAKIKEAGIDVVEEISCFNPDSIVDNVILRDPGGTGFFIFND